MSEKTIKSNQSNTALTRQQLLAVINEKLENTLYWLSKAYGSRPQDDESERTLLEVMAGLQGLQRRVNQNLSTEAMEAQGMVGEPQQGA